jgi:hypothetical protein
MGRNYANYFKGENFTKGKFPSKGSVDAHLHQDFLNGEEMDKGRSKRGHTTKYVNEQLQEGIIPIFLIS